MTAKEDCFEEAADAYQRATGKDLKLEHKAPWRQNMDGSWSQEPRGFWAAVNSMMKFINGLGHADSVRQVRVPDVTVNTPNGPLVVDLKFTRGNGTVDDWRTQPGAGNGNTQRQDYNDINRQTDPNAQDMKLDPQSCGCDQRGAQPEYVVVPDLVGVPGHELFFLPLPGGFSPLPSFPMPAPMPAPIPVPIIP